MSKIGHINSVKITKERKTPHNLLLSQFAHHGKLFFSISQVVADAPCREEVGEAGHLVDNLALGHHNEEDRN